MSKALRLPVDQRHPDRCSRKYWEKIGSSGFTDMQLEDAVVFVR